MRHPVSTYRLQIREEFGFQETAAVADYLAELGVSHAYLSPILAATPGSTHGYDVVDHSQLSADAGGRAGFDAMSARLKELGLGAVSDVVPNHMAVPNPLQLNAQLWSVLRDGPDSPYADWFDVDWSADDQQVLMPILGSRIGDVLARGELTIDTSGDEPLLRYFDRAFPLRAGTEQLSLAQLVDRQFYRLAYWKVADEELNYRRFFDVDTLAAIRVEEEHIFEPTHRLLLDLYRDGKLDGFRIDHPDGLAEPRNYLRQLASGSDQAWVVVEKILEGEERLPRDWPCAGTTGYDALQLITGVFVDPMGEPPLSVEWINQTASDVNDRGERLVPLDYHQAVRAAKLEVAQGGLRAEVDRLVDLLVAICADDLRLRDHTRRGFSEVVTELLVAFDRYRAYVVPGEPAPAEAVHVVDEAVQQAREQLPEDRHDTLDLVRDLVLGIEVGSAGMATDAHRGEFITRFQQTCGPVMAKGIEDTTFYRWLRLAALNEVGGDPSRFGFLPEEFHAHCRRMLQEWPLGMTTLSTHDTKRAEDTRAQLAVLSQVPAEWTKRLEQWREATQEHRGRLLDGATEYLIWQTVFGTWDPDSDTPITADRLIPYLEKAIREAKLHTTWTAQNEPYEQEVRDFATAVLGDADVLSGIGDFVGECLPLIEASILGQKLVQLTMPGVPDVYQGTELLDHSLVDPDNRRAVDYQQRRDRLRRLQSGARPADLADRKLRLTSTALRLRRDHPEVFVGEHASYAPVPATTSMVLGFSRGTAQHGPTVISLATRLPKRLERLRGWGEHEVALPAGTWRDLLTDTEWAGGTVRIAELFAQEPVALLVRED